jgi:hypothetical protein
VRELCGQQPHRAASAQDCKTSTRSGGSCPAGKPPSLEEPHFRVEPGGLRATQPPQAVRDGAIGSRANEPGAYCPGQLLRPGSRATVYLPRFVVDGHRGHSREFHGRASRSTPRLPFRINGSMNRSPLPLGSVGRASVSNLTDCGGRRPTCCALIWANPRTTIDSPASSASWRSSRSKPVNSTD